MAGIREAHRDADIRVFATDEARVARRGAGAMMRVPGRLALRGKRWRWQDRRAPSLHSLWPLRSASTTHASEEPTAPAQPTGSRYLRSAIAAWASLTMRWSRFWWLASLLAKSISRKVMASCG